MLSSELELAIENGNVENVRTLINQGIDTNAKTADTGETALHLAVRYNSANIIKLLLNANVDTNLKDNVGIRAADRALGYFSLNTFKIFVDAGFDVHTQDRIRGHTALHMAALNNDSVMVEYFLSQCANVHARDKLGSTPLHLASDGKIVKCLLKNNADINAVDNWGRTPLMHRLDEHNVVIPHIYESHKEFLEYLVQYSDVNTIESKGKNIITVTSKTQLVEIVLKHLAKLQAVNHPINPVILDAISNKIDCKDYFKKCTEELCRAKNTKIHNSWVTFFNLLVDNKKSLKNYAGNQELVKEFYKSGCNSQFPIYGASMTDNFAKGIRMRYLFDESAELLSDCLLVFNPTHLVIRDILDCFGKKDLFKFSVK